MSKVQKTFNPEEFRVKFRAAFAIISFLVGMLFISLACFLETPAKSEHIGTIIGFICGTMITLILTYYFGSSDTQNIPAPIVKPPAPIVKPPAPIVKLPEIIKEPDEEIIKEPDEEIIKESDEEVIDES